MLSWLRTILAADGGCENGTESGVVVFALVAVLCAATTFVLVVFAAFIWLPSGIIGPR